MSNRSKRNLYRALHIAAEYGTALIIGIILYKLCRPYAVAWRGNTLYGGEVLMLGLPVWYGMVKSVVMDAIETRKTRRADDNQ